MSFAVRAISLDLDDTLWPFEPIGVRIEHNLHAWLQTYSPVTAAMYPHAAMRVLRAQITAAHPHLHHDLGALRQLTLAQALHNSGADPDLLQPLWEVFKCARNQVSFYPDSLVALRQMATRVPLVALSNGNADLERIGIADLFAFQLSAAEFGAAKPDPGIFHAVCARLHMEPKHVLHVGDDVALDVCGAMQAGLLGCWINRQKQVWPHVQPPDLQFENLSALAHWLGEHIDLTVTV